MCGCVGAWVRGRGCIPLQGGADGIIHSKRVYSISHIYIYLAIYLSIYLVFGICICIDHVVIKHDMLRYTSTKHQHNII